MQPQERNTNLIKALSRKYGFDGIGLAKAEFMTEEALRLENWLSNGNNASMDYLEEHFDKRVDPTKLVKGAKSVVTFLFNYFPHNDSPSTSDHKIARYAYGRDYHKTIKRKLVKLFNELVNEIGEFNGRCFVDSGPVLERDWAKRGGLGWKGKNSLLINPKKGSYFFLAEIICDLEFIYDSPIADHCGTCTLCIDACPTDAISSKGYVIDARKCISYLTIENKESIPSKFDNKFEKWIYGCDICQEVCPWNKFSKPHNQPDFLVKEGLSKMNKRDWEEITEEVFENIFFASAVKRTQYKGLKRNIDFLKRSV